MESIEYLVPDWVRVRRESFGLLFYDTRSTRLTFVRSGDALEPPAFVGGDRRLRLVMAEGGAGATPGPATVAVSRATADRTALARLLSDLVAKGLLVARKAKPDPSPFSGDAGQTQ
mgnify:CR=1 FL=1